MGSSSFAIYSSLSAFDSDDIVNFDFGPAAKIMARVLLIIEAFRVVEYSFTNVFILICERANEDGA